jgi:threonine dehydratase
VGPGGAAAFAALLSGGYRPRPGERVGILLSGGNTTAVNFEH